MDSQDKWSALEAKYGTPSGYEDPRLKTLRVANRHTARSRLQRRQIERAVRTIRGNSTVAGSAAVPFTQIELGVLARRYASLVLPENERAPGCCRKRDSSSISKRGSHGPYDVLTPVGPDESSTCNFGVRSSEAAMLKRTSLIVWDEAPMTHRFQYEAVDRTLRDLLKNDKPFGGVTMLLSGVFRQTLPVIPRAGPAEVIAASLKKSTLWRHFECFRLTTNMRV
ncbi:PIF1-like helicase [Phytophthora infestans]|uniref:ATP-dependent DNA helicase n=1 Tax=Phytophthora infestans TaxID=4787 RepID=A0A833W332_PHYIN|nr:PIF1-like helicase [Phytophthora infestans]